MAVGGGPLLQASAPRIAGGARNRSAATDRLPTGVPWLSRWRHTGGQDGARAQGSPSPPRAGQPLQASRIPDRRCGVGGPTGAPRALRTCPACVDARSASAPHPRNVGELALPRAPRPSRPRRRRQRLPLPAPRCPLAHPRPPPPASSCHPLLAQPPNLRVRDQHVLPEETGSLTRLPPGPSNSPPISPSPTDQIIVDPDGSRVLGWRTWRWARHVTMGNSNHEVGGCRQRTCTRHFLGSPQMRVGRGGAISMPPQHRNSIEMSASGGGEAVMLGRK